MMASSSPFYLRIPFLLLLLLLLPNISPATAQTSTNITSGFTLSPHNTTSWLSPSGDFAFGFHPLDYHPNRFLLAIWFDRTANKTIIWCANGDKPVQSGSSVYLTAAGDLSLKDDSGNEVWKAGVSSASYVALLDTGNLLIAASGGFPLWQSFNNPTDTILPSQTLGLGTQLRSRLTNTDYAGGRFVLSVQTDGNLVSYPLAIPTGNQYDSPYFASDTVGNGLRLVFDNSGRVYLSLKSGSSFNLTSPGPNSYQGFYQRASLDPDGVFRHYIYPKNSSSNPGWSAVDVQIPSDICRALDPKIGSGACGFNSYCKSGGGDNLSTDCECPPNYSFLDPSNKYRGCAPDFAAQSCTEDESALFDFVNMSNVDWPYSDYEMYNPISEDACQTECLKDCFCGVAIYNNGNCWKKKLPLSNGKMGSYVQRVALIKVRRANGTNIPPPSTIEIKKVSSVHGGWIAAGSSLLGTSVLVNFIAIAAAILLLTRKKQRIQLEAKGLGLSLRRFTYEELEEATNGFREELGRGAFGTVYKGQLQAADSVIPVAIKRLDKLLPDTEKEFDNEIKSIGQTHHKNLVRLLGFCSEGTERILVYEHMSNGDLTNFLFGSGERPGWNQRAKIATGIARGLLYLHEECANRIIHCDIKPQNVLLDDNFIPRISDFGLAKLLVSDQTRAVTGIRGTRGYVAPEWFKAVPGVTAKVDVYSFGVMLLEIVSCRRNVVVGLAEEEEILTFWAYDCYRDGRVGVLIEGDEEAEVDIKRVERFLAVAIWCIQEEPALRPSMNMVIQMLDGAVTIPVPPDPSVH